MTVETRVVQPTELRDFIPRAVGRLTEHCSALYESAVEALEPEPDLEAAAYFEYAKFRRGLGALDECRAYLYRAQELLEGGRDGEVKAGIRTELAGLGTHE